jgi:protein TonB
VAADETTAPAPEPDPLPQEGEVVGAGADVTEPQILKQATPRYPPAAARMRASGRAVISVLVGPNGRVQATKVIKSTGNPFLDDAATSAARDTTFSPPTKRGVRVSMYTVMSFDFALPR